VEHVIRQKTSELDRYAEALRDQGASGGPDEEVSAWEEREYFELM
jgi:hypothetical protein